MSVWLYRTRFHVCVSVLSTKYTRTYAETREIAHVRALICTHHVVCTRVIYICYYVGSGFVRSTVLNSFEPLGYVCRDGPASHLVRNPPRAFVLLQFSAYAKTTRYHCFLPAFVLPAKLTCKIAYFYLL